MYDSTAIGEGAMSWTAKERLRKSDHVHQELQTAELWAINKGMMTGEKKAGGRRQKGLGLPRSGLSSAREGAALTPLPSAAS